MTLAASVLSLALSGCTVIITTGIFSDASSSSGVQIIAAVTSHSAALDTVTTHVTNTSARAVFIPRCGSAPLLSTQQFVNGAWSDADSPTCPASSALSPIQLDPGLTLVAVSVLTQAGRFRFATTVGESEDFSNSARATSNSFSVLR
jgi:hypothetical protein